MIEHNLNNGLITASIGLTALTAILSLLMLLGAPITLDIALTPFIAALGCVLGLIVKTIVEILEEDRAN